MASLIGRYHVELRRAGRLVTTRAGHNMVPFEGKDHGLNRVFHSSGRRYSAWYLGLIKADPKPVLLDRDDWNGPNYHTGWEEEKGATGNRPEWKRGTPDDGILASSSGAFFNFGATFETVEVSGLFVVTNRHKSRSPSGPLWATMEFNLPVEIVANDQLAVQYQIEIKG